MKRYCPDCYKLLWWNNDQASCCSRLWLTYTLDNRGRDMVHTVTFTDLKLDELYPGKVEVP